MKLEIEHLHFAYSKKKRKILSVHEVFHDCSFSVASGEFFSIMGPSGCGKSTLLRILAGLLPYQGTIKGDGADLLSVSPQMRGFAYISQEYALYPHMTVYDNLAFPLKMQGADYEEINRRVLEVAEKLSMTPFLSRKPRNLSGGQQQRVALGRALIRGTRVYLLDEPFSNIDPTLEGEYRSLLRKIHDESGATFIYCTHALEEALSLSEKILVFSSSGVIEQIGTPREIYFHPATEEVASLVKANQELEARWKEICQ
jgi:ABC-type sugar transport system ATPase subunit